MADCRNDCRGLIVSEMAHKNQGPLFDGEEAAFLKAAPFSP
jgi:hypothetical protein